MHCVSNLIEIRTSLGSLVHVHPRHEQKRRSTATDLTACMFMSSVILLSEFYHWYALVIPMVEFSMMFLSKSSSTRRRFRFYHGHDHDLVQNLHENRAKTDIQRCFGFWCPKKLTMLFFAEKLTLLFFGEKLTTQRILFGQM